jgi:CRISPR-associated protein Cas2
MGNSHLTHLSAYRIMWLLVLFDLPTDTKKDRKAYADFRKKLLKDGFNMFQFSVYMRHCASRENTEVHKKRVKAALPPRGKIGLLPLTDKQFGDMEIYYGTQYVPPPTEGYQLELF